MIENITESMSNSSSSDATVSNFLNNIIMQPILTIGLVGNTFILYCGVKYKDLRNESVLLLAGFDFCGCFGTMLALYLNTFVLDDSAMSQKTCAGFSIPLMIGLFGNTIAVLLLGLDRALAMVCAQWYALNKRVALCFSAAVSCGHSFGFTLMVVLESSHSVVVRSCSPVTFMKASTLTHWLTSTSVINIGIVVVYGLLTVWLRNKSGIGNGNSLNGARDKYLIQSIVVVSAVHIFTWLLPLLAYFVIGQITELTEKQHAYLHLVVSCITVINPSSNAYIFIWRSRHYREAFVAVMKQVQKTITGNRVGPAPARVAWTAKADSRALEAKETRA